MRMCQHCGAGVPNYAGFCGECGRLVPIDRPVAQERTLWMSHTASPPAQKKTAVLTETEEGREQTNLALEDEEIHEHPIMGNDVEDEETHKHPTMDNEIENEETREHPTIDNEGDNEETQRRNELINFNLPLLADAIVEHPTVNTPMVQSTPHITGVPTVPGTPPILDRPLPSGGSIITSPLVLPDPEKVFTDSLTHEPQHLQRPGRPSQVLNKPQSRQPSGCMVWLIVAIIVPLIILASIIGIGFTILAPTLTLDGSTSVATGDVLHLHGGHFIPGNSVTCVLDGSTPLSYTSLSYPTRGADTMTGALVAVQQRSTLQHINNTTEKSASTTITVGSDGTFSATFVVGQDWKVGQHTIRATEALSPRSATTTFIVTGNGQTVSTATSTTTPTTTKKARGTPPPTPVSTIQAGLSAITPNILTFGPLSEGYTQATGTQVLLNTTGTGRLDWTASWNAAQASWLRLSAQSGQVQEPDTQTLIVSALVGNLKAGTYNTTILFSSNGPNKQNLSLPVSLTIQPGCLKASPTILNFTGIIGRNDPPAQTLTLHNCGALGSWTKSTSGSSWLLVSPTGGNLNNGATQSIIVSASLANVKSAAGTYRGQITFNNGSARAIVNVTFTVKVAPSPTLGSNITSFRLQQCRFVLTGYKCSIITLHSRGTAHSNLNWTTTSSIVPLNVIPQSGTLQPGQMATVEIDIVHAACAGSATIGTVTFSGPANSIIVTVKC